MIYWQIFRVFFVTNILGYGGGPATIPLVQHEVVEVLGWLTEAEFVNVLAMGNALPGPVATKMAGYIGFIQGGLPGAAIALVATVMPSIILMLTLMGILMRYRQSPQVKRLTLYVRPTVAVLLGAIAIHMFVSGLPAVGIAHMAILSIASYVCMERLKIHPALVVMAALVYGALLLG